MKVKTKLHVVLSLLLCCLMIVGVLPIAVLADDTGDTTTPAEKTTAPAHNKVLTPNADGTYTLSLSVTGSRTTSETESGKADVIVVLDTSGSMAKDQSSHEVSKTGRYGYDWLHDFFILYKQENGQYVELSSDDFSGTVYQKRSPLWGSDYYERYNGTRYFYNATGTRIDVAKSAVNALAEQLLSQNTDENNPQILLSLITFNDLASLRTPWTSDLTAFKKSVSEIICRKNEGGTNWEDALDEANKLQPREGADVYVIFVSDGQPTYRNTQGTREWYQDQDEFKKNGSYPNYYYGTGNSDKYSLNYDYALGIAKDIVAKKKNLYCIGAFGQEDQMRNLAIASDAGEKNYYSASNQQALLAAFANIATRITNTLGYKNITITDPLTEMTSTSLKVAEDGTVSGFTYTRSGGKYGTGETWEDAPKANFDRTTVTWNLKNEDGSDIYLENGVTYTVSFKVWPSPEAYETVAAIMNGEEVAKPNGIVQLTDGSYGLNTNGKATIKYTQVETTTSGGNTSETPTDGEADFTNPAPIPLNVGKLTVTKVWEDNDDALKLRPGEVTINVLRQIGSAEATVYKAVVLNSAFADADSPNIWTTDVYVAPAVGNTVYSYTVEEVSVKNYTSTITPTEAYAPKVANDGSIKPAEAPFTVTNTLDTANSLTIKKEFSGDFAGLTEEDKATISFTVSGPYNYEKTIWYSEFSQDDEYTINNLPVGEYTVTETAKAPAGYTLNTTYSPENGKVTLVKNGEGEVTVTNTYNKLEGGLTITKKFDGATLTDAQKANITFTVKGPEGFGTQKIQYSKFNKGTSHSFGLVPLGEYTITESNAQVPGYSLSVTSSTSESSLSKVSTFEVDSDVDYTTTCTVKDDTGYNVVITNTYTLKEAKLIITKDFEDEPKELNKNNIEFSVVSNGKTLAGTEFSKVYKYSEFKNGELEIPLPLGTYTVTESNANVDGYERTTTYNNKVVGSIDVELTENSDVTVAIVNSYRKLEGGLTITKTFVGAEEIAPADKEKITFTVIGPNGFDDKVISYKDFTKVNDNDNVAYYYLNSVPAGRYTVIEKNAYVNGYTLEATSDVKDIPPVISMLAAESEDQNCKAEFEITDRRAYSVNFTNTYKKIFDDTPTTVKIPFTKIVEQGGSIAPSSETFQLEIVDFDKNSGMSYTAKVTTDGKGRFDGYIEISGPKDTVDAFVEKGFKVREVYTSYANWRYSEDEWIVKAVANGFVFCLKDGNELIPHDKMTFVNTYTNNSNEDHFVIIPEYWSLRLTKVDANDPTYRLAGAQFDLYRVGKTYDTCVGHYTTNSAGEARAAVTRRGEYYWVETQSPAGYTLDTTRHYTHTDTQDRYITVENVKTEAPTVLNSEDHYAYVIGYEDGLVHPEAQITRAETATIFFRLLNEDVRSAYMTKVNSFSDVHEDDWFNTAVSTMASLGMIKGYPDGTFGPNDPITRAEFAAIAARFDPSEISGVAAFTDIAGHWSEPEVSKAAANGWVNGYTDNSFKPDQNITRAEAMALVNRVLNRNPGSPENLLPDMITWPDNMDLSAWYYLDVQEATNSHTYERQPNNTELWIKINEAPDWTILDK